MIPNDELRVLLSVVLKGDRPIELLDMGDMEMIFEKYGDDWFMHDGEFQLTNKNELRMQVMNIYGRNLKSDQPS